MAIHLPREARERFVEEIAAARKMDELAADRAAMGDESAAVTETGMPAARRLALVIAGEPREER